MLDLFFQKIVFHGNARMLKKEFAEIIVGIADVFCDVLHAEIEIITHVDIIKNIGKIILVCRFVFVPEAQNGKNDAFGEIIQKKLKHGFAILKFLIAFLHQAPDGAVGIPVNSVCDGSSGERETDINQNRSFFSPFVVIVVGRAHGERPGRKRKRFIHDVHASGTLVVVHQLIVGVGVIAVEIIICVIHFDAGFQFAAKHFFSVLFSRQGAADIQKPISAFSQKAFLLLYGNVGKSQASDKKTGKISIFYIFSMEKTADLCGRKSKFRIVVFSGFRVKKNRC